MEITAEYVAKTLGGARRSGDNWSCRCPSHEDNHASLSITQKSDGKFLVHCHAGCEPMELISVLRSQQLWPDAVQTPKPSVIIDLPGLSQLAQSSLIKTIVATYDYIDESGELLYQAVRYEPKDFRQRRPVNGSGAWDWSLKGVRRVLYRLPEVLEAIATNRTVYICEGEKDVEVARGLGLVATCNAMGADNGTGNKWSKEFGDVFRGANVVVVPDMDAPGERHATWVMETLKGKAQSIKLLKPMVGKDLADWVDAGAGVEEFRAHAVDVFAHVEKPTRTKFKLVDVYDLIRDIKPIDWMVKNYFERDSIALVYGQPGCGKSFFAVDIASSIAMSHPWFGNKVKSGAVIYIAGEGHNGLARRFKAWEIARGVEVPRDRIFKSAGALSILDELAVQEMVEVIEEQIKASGEVPAAVVVDTLARNFGAGDENSTEDMSKFIHHLDHYIRQRWNCLVLIVHHSGHGMERARGSSALKAAVDSEVEITKDAEGVVNIRVTKMKDADIPPEMVMSLKGVELDGLVDDEGEPVTSAVLEHAGNLAQSVVGQHNDKTKMYAHEVLAALLRCGFLSEQKMAFELSCARRQFVKAMATLTTYKFIDSQGKEITTEGRAALSRLGHELKAPKSFSPGVKFYHEPKESDL
jgi:KaiC/GvpD/RAD55 family RecA-like ATPase